MFKDRGFTSGCIGFDCGQPHPAPPPGPRPPAPPPMPPRPPPPPLPFDYVTPFFAPFGWAFANSTDDALRDPTTAIFESERGGHWHVYCSSMVCRGPGGGQCGGGYPVSHKESRAFRAPKKCLSGSQTLPFLPVLLQARIRHFSVAGTLEAGPAARHGKTLPLPCGVCHCLRG